MTADVVLDGESLTPADVVAVARNGATVTVAETARERIRESRERVESVLDSDEAVYGVTTGFGDLVDERIPREDLDNLQRNLLRSHAAAVGRELTTEEVRAMMVTRANTLAKGYSGIRESVVDLLVAMLDAGVHPVVPSRGSLGASGDLAPLAHMSLVLIGEGDAEVEGDRLPGDEALDAADLEPVTLRAKEGLALINGTQLTVGVAALLLNDAEQLVAAADIAGALTTEVTLSSTVPSHEAITAVRPHAGQAASARNVRRLTADSDVVESHRNCDRVQDAYAMRCLPQVHGAVRDAVGHLREAVEVELNSATDNPLVFPSEDERSESSGRASRSDRREASEASAVSVDDRASGSDSAGVLSGGNFHGAVLAMRLDYLTNALTELAAISERRTDRMLNPNLQEPHLPPFLTERSGVRSGYMIAQYTAAALLNECRSFGRPSMDNTPVSGNQEDHVSMSAQSAYLARKAARNAAAILGVELCCGAQAADFVDDDLELGVGSAEAYDAVRAVVPKLTADRPVHEDIEAASTLVESPAFTERVAAALDEALE
ncbi:histidine ammonia-lyase [Haloarcula japonica]|uniref:Probable histidine ammonia-lyase n=1 Tax=Haloarcula japonica (strain ATCC 49778 / DSM 6131 / JCM 7785 / NBRC 101032 / NCIMB 13157 / TR-1) TaxID=1227453 RepID=M0LM84_HALJT|nr:histidine ammonia-lyase [Haloarcula japonica]EMA33135.1 histidine ammonia-lyase [Haloarcula japonica DSM 6131]